MQQVSQVPIEYQEKILDILRGMAFTKKCLAKEHEHSIETEKPDVG